MDQRSQYLIQIIEKLGTPLIGAVSAVAARQDPGAAESSAPQDAEKVAGLLSRAVQCSIEIGKSIDMTNLADQGESVRLALAALASYVIADYYRQSGRMPGDTEIKRAVSALQAVLTFAENFTPDPANTERLKQMQAQGAPADGVQANLQFLRAFVPVVNAIASFSFGQPESRAIQDVSNRLTKRAEAVRQQLFAQAGGDEAKLAELALLRALASLYAQCHEAEVARLSRLSEEQRAAQSLSLEPVWKAFEVRAAMLEALAPALVGQQSAGAGGSKAPAAPQPVQPPAAQQPPPQAQSQGTANPMAGFVKPQQPGDSPPPPPASPPQGGGQGDSQSGGSPMSFFKKSE